MQTLERPTVTDDTELTNEEILSEEQEIKVCSLVSQAIAANSLLFDSIGQLYKIMVAGGKKKTRQGQSFKDVIAGFDKSASRCYEIGQSYLIKEWAIIQFEEGTLSFNPKNLKAACFEALRRLELPNKEEEEILQDKLVVLESAYLSAKKRSDEGLPPERIRITEEDIHEAIDVEPTIKAQSRKPKRPKNSSDVSKREEELQSQLREQGQALRAEKERRIEAETKAKELEFLVEERVRERLEQILSERDTLRKENEALKVKLETLYREPTEHVPETRKRSLLGSIIQAKKSAPPIQEENTNQPNFNSILVSEESVWEEGIPDLVAKKQKLGISVYAEGEELVIQGLRMNLDAELLQGLMPLDDELVQVLGYFQQECGEVRVFRSHNNHYWQLPGDRNIQIGGKSMLGRQLCSALGMTASQIKQAILDAAENAPQYQQAG